MVRVAYSLFLLTACSLSGTAALAQAPVPPIAPAVEGAAEQIPAPTVASDGSASYVLPPMVSPRIPGLDHHPLLEPNESPPCGWFGNVETSFVGFHLSNRLVNTVTVSPTRTDTVQFTTGHVDWTVQPRFEIGYRLPRGLGEFQLTYNFLSTQGDQQPALGPVAGHEHDRLDMNWTDLDYASREFSLWPHCDMRWLVGVRFAWVYFDTLLQVLDPADSFGGVAGEAASSYYWSVGPRAGLELSQALPMSGLALVGRIEGASLYGRIRQRFSEQLANTAVDSPGAFGTLVADRSLTAPVLSLHLGLSYVPPGWDACRFSLGYQFDQWWLVGRLDDSRADVTDQGFFLRAEFDF